VALTVQVVKAPRTADAKRVERLVRRAFRDAEPGRRWAVRCCHLGLWSLFYVTVWLEDVVVRRFVRPTDDLEEHVRGVVRTFGSAGRAVSREGTLAGGAPDAFAAPHGSSLS